MNGVDWLGYPLPAKTEACSKLRHLRTASDPLEIISEDGSLPACVDFYVAEFMYKSWNSCKNNKCGSNYPGGCGGLLERVFPDNHDYYQIIDDCRSVGAK